MLSPGALLHQINSHWRRRFNPSDPTFGKTTIGDWDDSGSANYLTGCRFELIEDGDVTKITWYCAASAGTVNAYALIYSDDAGAPDSKLGKSAEVTLDTTLAWRDFAFSPPISLTAGFYWLCFICNGSHVYKRQAGATNQRFWVYTTYCDEMSPISGQSYDNWEVSIYATYTVVAPPGVKAMYGGLYLVYPA